MFCSIIVIGEIEKERENNVFVVSPKGLNE